MEKIRYTLMVAQKKMLSSHPPKNQKNVLKNKFFWLSMLIHTGTRKEEEFYLLNTKIA